MVTNGYAHPESLVSADWLKGHLNNPLIRVIEVVWGRQEYEAGHIEGALAWDFVEDLGGTTARADLASQGDIEGLLSRSGIEPRTTIIVYSGLSNLLAAFAFWVLKLYGHIDVRLLDGGRQKWIQAGYALAQGVTAVEPTRYKSAPFDLRYRADKNSVFDEIQKGRALFIDCRPVEMFEGTNKAGISRAGHIPGAVNIPARMQTNVDGSFNGWATAYTQGDGTFKSAGELRGLMDQNNIHSEDEIITYCVRGGLSTQAWFVMTQLLGYPSVREYERSWEEWGNLPDTPIELKGQTS